MNLSPLDLVPYTYLEDEAIADIAFKATGVSLSELFNEASKAVFSLLTDISALENDIQVPIKIETETIEKLLYQFLDEIIYLKDADLFFPKSVAVSVEQTSEGFKVEGEFVGTTFDYQKYRMGNDIKAITYHDFYVKQVDDKWECYVLVDI